MLYFAGFHALMILLAIGVATKVISAKVQYEFITGLHYTIGISTPPQDQVGRMVIIWIVSVVVIVDMLYCLLLWVI